MRRYLLVALWPAGMAAIAAATVVAARRACAAPGAQPGGQPGRAAAGDPAGRAGGSDGGSEAARPAATITRGGFARAGAETADAPVLRSIRRVSDQIGALPGWQPDLARLGAMSCASGALSYGVMALLGPAVLRHGPAIDEPMYRWVSSHQVPAWAAIMERLNKIGNTWTTWGAAGTAAACLAVTYPRKKWLPPGALAAAIVVDHYATLALRYTFGRLGPPASPLGTYPSGGTDRIILFYGMIAHMLWREFSGTGRGKVWAAGALAGLSFNQAYCRQYLSKHWFTDIMAGFLYGGLLLAPFMAAMRWIAGPAVR